MLLFCSAGVGRSGTFIAIERIMQSLLTGASEYIDVFACVVDMRRYRICMVQSEVSTSLTLQLSLFPSSNNTSPSTRRYYALWRTSFHPTTPTQAINSSRNRRAVMATTTVKQQVALRVQRVVRLRVKSTPKRCQYPAWSIWVCVALQCV